MTLNALRLDGRRVFAGGADRQPERRAVEQPGDDADQDEGEIGQRRLREQRLRR